MRSFLFCVLLLASVAALEVIHAAEFIGNAPVSPLVKTLDISATKSPALNSADAAPSSLVKSSSPMIIKIVSTMKPFIELRATNQEPVVAPLPSIGVGPTIAPVGQTVAKLIAPIATTIKPKSLANKFALYMDPICENFDKIQADHLFRFQSQFKTFVDKVSITVASVHM